MHLHPVCIYIQYVFVYSMWVNVFLYSRVFHVCLSSPAAACLHTSRPGNQFQTDKPRWCWGSLQETTRRDFCRGPRWHLQRKKEKEVVWSEHISSWSYSSTFINKILLERREAADFYGGYWNGLGVRSCDKPSVAAGNNRPLWRGSEIKTSLKETLAGVPGLVGER